MSGQRRQYHTLNERSIMRDARKSIREALIKRGPYSHNIVSLTLSHVANVLGTARANQLVREFRNPCGIQEEEIP